MIIPKQGIKRRDSSTDTLEQYRMQPDQIGYELTYIDDQYKETIENFGDLQGCFHLKRTEGDLGSWCYITPAIINEDKNVVPLQANEEEPESPYYIPLDILKQEEKDSFAKGDKGLLVCGINNQKQELYFIPSSSTQQYIFKDIGETVELLKVDGTGTGKFYNKESLDPETAFHTGIPPYAIGRKYMGTIKKQPDGDVLGTALLDIQGHGESNNLPL